MDNLNMTKNEILNKWSPVLKKCNEIPIKDYELAAELLENGYKNSEDVGIFTTETIPSIRSKWGFITNNTDDKIMTHRFIIRTQICHTHIQDDIFKFVRDISLTDNKGNITFFLKSDIIDYINEGKWPNDLFIYNISGCGEPMSVMIVKDITFGKPDISSLVYDYMKTENQVLKIPFTYRDYQLRTVNSVEKFNGIMRGMEHQS
jgi:hypothetical protein